MLYPSPFLLPPPPSRLPAALERAPMRRRLAEEGPRRFIRDRPWTPSAQPTKRLSRAASCAPRFCPDVIGTTGTRRAPNSKANTELAGEYVPLASRHRVSLNTAIPGRSVVGQGPLKPPTLVRIQAREPHACSDETLNTFKIKGPLQLQRPFYYSVQKRTKRLRGSLAPRAGLRPQPLTTVFRQPSVLAPSPQAAGARSPTCGSGPLRAASGS